jgi:hypothetical protein
MNTIVIAATVTQGEQVARDAGIQRPIVLSPYSIKHRGAGRGLIAHVVLIDDSALPLDTHTLEMIDTMTAGRP